MQWQVDGRPSESSGGNNAIACHIDQAVLLPPTSRDDTSSLIMITAATRADMIGLSPDDNWFCSSRTHAESHVTTRLCHDSSNP